jgi:hypothetical protein
LDITSGREQLFDLDADGQERTSVAPHEAALAGWYADDLRDWSAAQEHRLKAHP